MKRLPSSFVKLLLFVAGAGILVWMIWHANPQQLWQHLQDMGWRVALLCVSVWGTAYVLNTLSWSAIVLALSGKRLSLVSMLRYTIAGYALNYITPMGLLGGEPYRVWALKPAVGVEKATSSVLLYAMMHFCSHFLFWIIGAVVALIVLSPIGGWQLVAVVAVFAVCLLLLWLFFNGYRSGLVMRLIQLLSHIPWVGGKIEDWQRRQLGTLQQIDEGIASLLSHHQSAFVWALGLELLARLVCCWEFMAVLPDWSYANCLLISAFSSLFANLLFFSPLQMGTREGGIALAMAWICGASPVSLMVLAVSVSMMTRIREFVWIAIGLILSAIGREHEDRKK